MNHSPDKPAVGGWDGIADPPPGRWCAAALLFTPDGRYLMQLRDDLARINFPDHWACFGGTIEPGETPEVAMRRELREELGFAAEAVSAFTEQRLVMPFPQPRLERLTFFAVPIAPEAVDGMVLMEGAAMTLFTPEQLALKARVAPWDLAAVIMHARRTALFRPAVAPAGRSD